MDARTSQISTLTSDYIEKRDNYVTRYKHRSGGLFAPGHMANPFEFSELVTEHAVQLAALLPPLSLAQWEGLSELAASYLAHLRMIEAKK